MFVRATKFVTNRISRGHSLDFIGKNPATKQQQYAEDDTSTCSSSESTLTPTPLPLLASERPVSVCETPRTASPIASSREARDFLACVRSASTEYRDRIDALNRCLRQQSGIAKGRYLHGNGTGACLAMKRVRRMEHERRLLLRALDVLLAAEVELRMALHEASFSSSASAAVAIGQHGEVLVQTHQLLLSSKTAEPLRMGRQQLLACVEELL